MKTIEARGVTLERNGRVILAGVDLTVSPASLLAVAGPNGSGKSTLLRALTGIWPLAAGEVRLDGAPLTRFSRREIARTISYVPQEARLDFGFTVRETVAMGRHPHRGRFAQEGAADRAAIDQAMEFCDVATLASRAVNTLSGGERQRVSIARSLAVEPQFLFLDEPTASLDVEHALDIFGLCQRLAAAGCAIVVCTHDLNAAARFAQSIALMKGGALVRQGRGEDVLAPDAIESVFGVRAEVVRSESGERAFFFHASSKKDA
jgi:iron complex transport system ATP-binding protein